MGQFIEAQGVEWDIACAIARANGIAELNKQSRSIRYRYRQMALAAVEAWSASQVTTGKT